jgi:excisionase family DNA binding protein
VAFSFSERGKESVSNTDTNKSDLMSEVEAARRCGVSRITLLRMRKAGKIGFYRIGTRVLFSESHINEFLNRVERKAEKQKGAA